MYEMKDSSNIRPINRSVLILFFIYMITYNIFSYRSDLIILSELVLIVLILFILIYIAIQKKIIIGSYAIMLSIFYLSICLSFYFSPEAAMSFDKIITLTQLILLSYLIYLYLDSIAKIEKFLKIILYSYIFLGIYSLYIFGLDNILTHSGAQRFGNEISQINILGVSLAIGAVMSFYYAYYERIKIFYLIMPFLFVMSSLTGSRKALVITFIGIFMLLILKNNFKKILNTVLTILFTTIVFFSLIQLPMFDTVLLRMTTLMNFFNGEGPIDNSTLIRSEMMSYGIEVFKTSPLIGYGLDSFRHFYELRTGWSTYSHNNYIELLVGLGLLGFLSYYSLYIYVFYNIIKMSIRIKSIAILLLILIVIQLFVDYGAVTYYSKITYIQLAIFFACIRVHKFKMKTENDISAK